MASENKREGGKERDEMKNGQIMMKGINAKKQLYKKSLIILKILI